MLGRPPRLTHSVGPPRIQQSGFRIFDPAAGHQKHGRPLPRIQELRKSSGGILHSGRHQHHRIQLADGHRCQLLPSGHPGLLGGSLPPHGDNGLNLERKPGRR